METNKKTSLVYIACSAVFLALLGAFLMLLALASDFTPSLGYFNNGSVKAALLYAVLAAGVALGVFAWIFLRRIRLSDPALPMPIYTKAASMLLLAALLWHTGDDLLGIMRTAAGVPYWGLVLLSDLLALLFIVSLVCDMGPDKVRGGSLAAFSGFFPPFYAAAQLFLLYFDETIATNSPIKIIYQLMYIAFMLLFTAQTGLSLGRKTIFPRYVFTLICSISLGGTVSVSALLCSITGTQGHSLHLSQGFFCFAVTVYALCRLLSLALSTVQLTKPKEKEA